MSEAEITSARSPRVVQVRQLHERRHRAKRGAFCVEGPQAVEAAVGHGMRELFATPSAHARFAGLVAEARKSGARVTVVSDQVLDAMAETRTQIGRAHV